MPPPIFRVYLQAQIAAVMVKSKKRRQQKHGKEHVVISAAFEAQL